jgi:23S rRNA (pseudouridine1915-N3)-methyltransferase
MKLVLIAVGKTAGVLDGAIEDYAARAGRYWPIEIVQVKEEKARKGGSADDVRDAEGERLLKRVPKDFEMFALTRRGDAWTSERLSRHIQRTADQALPGIAFLIGGAYGLGDEVLREADRRMRLSTYTFPHDLARLILLEQIYRAGTIARGEPYHKGRDVGDG